MPSSFLHCVRPRSCWKHWIGVSEVWSGGALSARTLLWLRWLAATGQGITLWVVAQTGVELPWPQCCGALIVTVFSNAVLAWWLRQVHWEMGEGFFHVLLWDVFTLTFLLHWTGGLGSPFALFYVVQLTLAAVALRTSAVIGLGVATGGGLVWLWQNAIPLRWRGGQEVPTELLHLGFFVALVLAAGVVLWLLLSLRRRSYRLQKERERLRSELESRDRFLSVAVLATGFAHELGTPLGTIALAAEELRIHPDVETATIIVREADRCRMVLQRLRELGQEATGRSAELAVVGRTIDATLEELPPGQRSRVRTVVEASEEPIACAGLREALLVLLRNALLSSSDDTVVSLRLELQDEWVRFIVEDSGPGFSVEMLAHWGEPFRTTRDTGAGLGLGLFFVRRLAASMHGSVTVENRIEGGARVTFLIPRHTHHSTVAT